MMRKVFGYVIAFLVIVSSYNIVLPSNKLNVAAADPGEGNAINCSYIRFVAESLSNIVFGNEKGRWFGTDGEWAAKRNISKWMNESSLWTKQEPLLDEKSTYFEQHAAHYNFTSELVVKDSTLYYQYNSGTPVEVKDFYLSPRWHQSSFRSLRDNFSKWSDMTDNYTVSDVSILPRPYGLSKILNGFVQGMLFQIISFLVNNPQNESKFICWFFDNFLGAYNLTIQEIEVYPENASQIEGFLEDTQVGRCNNYSFIWENQQFNPDKDERYWQGWNEIFDVLLVISKDNINATRLFSLLKSSKILLETWLWSCCEKFKGMILYDHNNDTYDMNYLPFFPEPMIYVNRSLGQAMVEDRENYTLSYSLDQEWKEGIESYNVIGQLNGTGAGDDYVLIGCLYDGWHNQATADSAIGMGLMLAMAKFLKELGETNVKPKTTIRFVAFSGEEAGVRGGFSYLKEHQNDNISLIIDLNQLGYNQSDPQQALWVFSNNPITNAAVATIASDTDFVARVNNATDFYVKELKNTSSHPYISDHTPFYYKGGYNILSFVKEDTDFKYSWRLHHRDGLNHAEGDSMKHYDDHEVNVTAELIWNVTRYFILNPDCRFNGTISYAASDSPDDLDATNDTISATFSVVTCLPVDKVRVNASVINCSTNSTVFWKNFDFITTSTGTRRTINVTLLPNIPEGNYRLYLQLYNSTSRINEIVMGSGVHNDSDLQSGFFYLTPRGNTRPNKPCNILGPETLKVGTKGTFNSSATDPNNDNLQYLWDWNQEQYNYVSPYESGEACSITHMFKSRGRKVVQVRVREDFFGQLYDGPLQGMSQYRYGTNWSDWSNPFYVNVKFLLDFDMSCTAFASALSAAQSTMLPSIQDIDSIYEGFAFGGIAPYNYTWYFEDNFGLPPSQQTVAYNYSHTGIKTVTLNVTDSEGYSEEITANITVVNISASFNLSLPSLYTLPRETITFNDTSAVCIGRSITNWTWDFGDGAVCYDRNATHSFSHLGLYTVTLTVMDTMMETAECSKQIAVTYDMFSPEITYVDSAPDSVGFGFDVTIVADVIDDISGVDSVSVNITYPDTSTVNSTMTPAINDTYFFVFNDTWQTGVYNYSIWMVDYANNTNCVGGFTFTVAINATISVVTLKDSYTGTEFINLTDPPGDPAPSLGYELLDDGDVLHLWNQYDSYYFNTSSGIQLTNHKDQYWSRNVLMLGYYNNDQWNLIYRTDELTGFIKSIETDNVSFMNVTLWKDLTYNGYAFRLAIRYHLGIDDRELTVIPYIKNLGVAIPYTLGFAWEINDIQVAMTPENDYLEINGTRFPLNESIDVTYKHLVDPTFSITEILPDAVLESLSLRWSESLNYLVWVKTRAGEYNAPVILGIKIGTLNTGQEKRTELLWHDASQMTYYFNQHDRTDIWATNPDSMVDGNLSNYASTTMQNDVELCDTNTCNGTSLGTISKVELRAYGYCSSGHRDIILQPIFNGHDHGNNYSYSPSSTPAWSSWFDITNDQGRQIFGTWNWSEVQNLDCDVTSQYIQFGAAFNLLCSKIELRVTYNNAPVITNPVPPHGGDGIALLPWLNITVADPNGDMMNLTWYSNSTPSFLTLRPNANGSTTQLERYPSSQNANYKCVDETTTNDSDYVKWKGTSWKKDTYNLSNHSSQAETIHDVIVYARCARVGSVTTPTTTSSAKIVIRSGGVDYYGSEFKPPHSMWPPISYTNYAYTWKNNPATGNAWSWTDIDNLQAGITFIGNEGTSECTQLYVVVNYTNPSTWLQFGRNSSVNNGTYRQRFLNASMNGQWWYWKVKADDGTLSTWSSVYKFYTGYQSKIENTGETTIKGYLLMQVQYYNETLECWVVDNDTVNETTPRTINSSTQLGLDTIFNGQVRASDLTHGAGTYRVYAAFRDPEGNILNTSDKAKLEAWWQFTRT